MKRRRFNTALFISAFMLLAGAVFCHAWFLPKLYESFGVIRILEDHAVHPLFDEVRSPDSLRRVAGRIMKDRAKDPLSWQGWMGVDDELALMEMLKRFDVSKHTLSDGIIAIGVRHENRQVAARITGYRTDEMFGIEARRRIDESMKQVEALVLVAKRREQKVVEIKNKLDAEATGSEAEARLKRELLAEQKELDEIVARLRGASMITGPRPSSVHIVSKPRIADEDAYSREPIFHALTWGWAAALVLAATAGCIFKQERNKSDAMPSKWRAALVRPLGRVERIVVFTTLASGVTISVLNALAMPRVYQASVVITFSESARRDYGWGELGVDHLVEWLPTITGQVVGHLGGDRMRRRWPDESGDFFQIEAKIHKGLKACRRDDGLELFYRHEDPVAAARGLGAFTEAYERYPSEWVRRNPDFERRQGMRRTLGGMSPNPVVVVEQNMRPTSGDYLLSPIILKIGAGCGVTLLCVVAMVLGGRAVFWRLGRP